MARAFERVESEQNEVALVSEVNLEECAILINAFNLLIKILTPDQSTSNNNDDVDPLFDQLGLGGLFDQTEGTEPREPTEPMAARLFPPGYVDDASQAHDFRRFTEPDLRKQKIDNAEFINKSLAVAAAEVPPRVIVQIDDVTSWLMSINDLRLTLGVQLGIGEPDEMDRLVNPDIRHLRELYDFLTWWQGSLLEVLS